MNSSSLYIISIIKYSLKAYKIAFKEKAVYKVLTTDPDFPSMSSISKTLSYFGLETSAYQLFHFLSIWDGIILTIDSSRSIHTNTLNKHLMSNLIAKS